MESPFDQLEAPRTKPYKEKRRGPDVLSRFITWLAIGGWGLLLASMIAIHKAKPGMENFFDRYFDVKTKAGWDHAWAETAITLMAILALVAVAGLALNVTRLRRKTDRINQSLIFLLILALLGVTWLVVTL